MGLLAFGEGGLGLQIRPAEAQDFAAAGQHFASAQDAFAQSKYELAAKEFQAAYDITHDPALLVNIGESWQRAGNGQKALAGYKAYLAAQPQAPDHAEIEGRVQALESALASQPTAPTAPTDQAPAAEKPAAAGQSGAATAAPAAGEKATAAPEKEKKAAEKEGPPTVTPPTGPVSGLQRAAWVGVAVSVALATAGAIVGMGAQNRADELRRRTTLLIGNLPPVYDSGEADAYTSLMSEGNAYNQAAIALLATAGAAALTTGILFIADYTRRPKERAKKATTGLALLPMLVPASSSSGVAGGLSAQGSF